MSAIQLVGAATFGAVIGWYTYYLNRYRKDERKLGDLLTLVSVLGGGTILALFPSGTDLFGAYGIGLFGGFFGYFVLLNIYVSKSEKNFNAMWFLDGRRKKPQGEWIIPEERETTMGKDGKEKKKKQQQGTGQQETGPQVRQ